MCHNCNDNSSVNHCHTGFSFTVGWNIDNLFGKFFSEENILFKFTNWCIFSNNDGSFLLNLLVFALWKVLGLLINEFQLQDLKIIYNKCNYFEFANKVGKMKGSRTIIKNVDVSDD